MHFRFRTSFLLVAIILPHLISAQEFRIENITSEYIRIDRGLSQNTAFCIIQDSEGFLWIGTWSGLNRFDGYSFKTLMRNPSEPSIGLTHSTINGLAEDTLGYIWASCKKGLNRIDKRDLKVRQFTTDNSASAGMVADSINTLYKARDGKLWIGTGSGALLLDPATQKFTHLEHNPRDFTTLSSNLVTAFCEDSSGHVWIGTGNGLNRLDRETGQLIRYYREDKPGSLFSSVINCLEKGEGDDIWIGTPAGLHRYRSASRSFGHYSVTSPYNRASPYYRNHISSLFSDKDGNLWVGTRENGLFIFSPTDNRFIDLVEITPESDFFRFNEIHCIMQDRNDLYWIGTSHRGMVKMVTDPHAFFEIFSSYSVFGIIEPYPDQLWFGTREGILVWDRKTKARSLIQQKEGDPNSLTSNLVNGLIEDGQYIWVLTSEGANRIRKDNGTNRKFVSDDSGNSIAGNNIWHVLKDSQGKYWLSTATGLSCWDPETDDITNYYHDPQNRNSLSNNSCYHVFEEKPGSFLISTQYGLNGFTPATGSWKVYLPVKGDPSSIGGEYVFGVFRDAGGRLWVYTNGGGFSRFTPGTGRFETYTTENGLSDNTVYGIYEDLDGIFWLTTTSGLSRFDPTDGRFTNFNVQEGLLSNEFNLNSLYCASNGEVYLGGINGVNAFLPQTTLRTSLRPIVRITDFTVHGDAGSYPVPVTDTIRLRSSGNTFSISFSALDFLNPFKNQYSYYLDNYDKDITTLQPGIHQADYRKVPPGHYSFKVRGINSIGIESDELVQPLIVIPAWYQTFWFRVAIALLVFMIAGSIVYMRLRTLHNRHEIEKQLLTTQTELVRSQKFALRSQMNPHFIFNSLNSIQNFVLKNDVDSANYYLSNFSTLMRKVLDYSQYNFILLAEEMELIQLYLKMELMRFSNKFEVDIRIDPAIDQYMVKIPPMLLQPYLENAILHGLQLIKHKGLLQVRVDDHGEHMQINIIDNGIGRERASTIRAKIGHKSKGLANIEKRIQLYNKISDKNLVVRIIDLTDDSGLPAGTRVEITIPYDMEGPSDEIY